MSNLAIDLAGGASVADRTAYFVDSAGRSDAVDINSEHVQWSVPLGPSSKIFETCNPVVTSDTVVVDVQGDMKTGGWTLGIDRRSGKTLWRTPVFSTRSGLPLYVGNTLIAEDKGIIGLDRRTGQRKWRVDSDYPCVSTLVVGDRLVCSFDRHLLQVDPQDGRVLWSYRLRSDKEWDLPIKAVRTGDTLLVSEEPFAALTLDGKELWRNREIDGNVLWSDGRLIVTEGLHGLSAYEHGTRPQIPTFSSERRMRAVELCARLSTLDDASKGDLLKLGEPAFEPLLRKSVELATDYRKGGFAGDDELLDELPGMLAKLITARYVPDLVREVRRHPVNETVGRVLLPALLMAKCGTERENVSLCLWVLGKQPPTAWPGSESSMALSYLRVCKDPRAMRYVRRWNRRHSPTMPRLRKTKV